MVIPVNQNFLNRTSLIGFVESEFLELRLLEPEHFEGQHYCTKSDACALENSKIFVCPRGRGNSSCTPFTWTMSSDAAAIELLGFGENRRASLSQAGGASGSCVCCGRFGLSAEG